MSGSESGKTTERPALPRDAFRHQRASVTAAAPVIVTPDYGDRTSDKAAPPGETANPGPEAIGAPAPRPRQPKFKAAAPRNPFDAYGERTSSRPYALRLPDAIDLVLRQMAAEARTHPLRVIDRILHDHLKRVGRLPPPGGA